MLPLAETLRDARSACGALAGRAAGLREHHCRASLFRFARQRVQEPALRPRDTPLSRLQTVFGLPKRTRTLDRLPGRERREPREPNVDADLAFTRDERRIRRNLG